MITFSKQWHSWKGKVGRQYTEKEMFTFGYMGQLEYTFENLTLVESLETISLIYVLKKSW